MNFFLAIGLILLFIVLVLAAVIAFQFLGLPYWNIRLLGTEYITRSHQLSLAMNLFGEDLYLVKRYKYSTSNFAIGWGGGSTYTTHYYAYGVADRHKKILIKPIYRFIEIRMTSDGEGVICGQPYFRKGGMAEVRYLFRDGRVELAGNCD